MEYQEEIYKSLIEKKVDDMSNDDFLAHLGKLIDLSWNLKSIEGLEQAINLSKDLIKRHLSSEQSANLHYFIANAWADLKNITIIEREQAWQWEQDEMEKQIFHLRSALQSEGFSKLAKELQCQIVTNLANALNSSGRFIEAIDYWNRALEIVPSFAMAQGNRGYGLYYFAHMLYDPGHAKVFLRYAYNDLNSSLKGSLNDDAKISFHKMCSWIERVLTSDFLRNGINMESFSLGDSDEEIRYRRWCLKNRFFLNPLNELGHYPIAARDILTTPNIAVDLGEGPYYPGYFNQMKQEFVSARYLYFEGINSSQPHFSDKGVCLFNTLDYPSYSLAVEKVKAAFRIAYSLFDKLAYFLNHYLRLGIPEKEVSFRSFWYESLKKKNGLREEFKRSQNLVLRGLFWLSKDLYENRPGFKEVLNPEAKDLWDIRNHLEHKYLKLHESMWSGPPAAQDAATKALTDTLAYSLYRKNFEQKTFRLLKMAREALIYLSLAIHGEEKTRSQEKDPGRIFPMAMDTWEDDWKV